MLAAGCWLHLCGRAGAWPLYSQRRLTYSRMCACAVWTLPLLLQWRAFSNQHQPASPATRFVDGDLIEQFLDLK